MAQIVKRKNKNGSTSFSSLRPVKVGGGVKVRDVVTCLPFRSYPVDTRNR